MNLAWLAGVSLLVGGGCARQPAAAESSSRTVSVPWDTCAVRVSGDSSFRDLPPRWRDPGPDAIVISGSEAGRGSLGPLPYRAGMTLAEALKAVDASAGSPLVLWRCRDGELRSFRPRSQSFPLRSHDWIVVPDPASVY